MIDYKKYNLITKNENSDLFDLQESIIDSNSISEVDKVIRLVLLLSQSPIADHETAIKLLFDFSKCNLDERVLILGAEFNSFLPIYTPNPFIQNLVEKFDCYANKEKSIIKYLEAINLNNSIIKQRKNVSTIVVQLLKESIRLECSYVNNYYRLALLSKRSDAKQLMEIALSNVMHIYNDITFEELLSYENYIDDFITGIKPSKEHYELLEEFYKSL